MWLPGNVHRLPSINIYTSEYTVEYLTPTLIGTSGLFIVLTLSLLSLLILE